MARAFLEHARAFLEYEDPLSVDSTRQHDLKYDVYLSPSLLDVEI